MIVISCVLSKVFHSIFLVFRWTNYGVSTAHLNYEEGKLWGAHCPRISLKRGETRNGLNVECVYFV